MEPIQLVLQAFLRLFSVWSYSGRQKVSFESEFPEAFLHYRYQSKECVISAINCFSVWKDDIFILDRVYFKDKTIIRAFISGPEKIDEKGKEIFSLVLI